jgi:hypothetical protein
MNSRWGAQKYCCLLRCYGKIKVEKKITNWASCGEMIKLSIYLLRIIRNRINLLISIVQAPLVMIG